jgi:hypothetical protein
MTWSDRCIGKIRSSPRLASYCLCEIDLDRVDLTYGTHRLVELWMDRHSSAA